MDSVTPAGEPERPARPVARRPVLQAAAVALGAVPVAGCDSGTDRSPAAASTSGPAPTGSGPAPGSPTASASTAGAALPAELAHGPRDRPNVALTFHGQGDPGQVRALLDELDRGGARVTVLAGGSWVQAEPAMAPGDLEARHQVGHHTPNHLAIAGLGAAHAYAASDHRDWKRARLNT